MIATADFIAKLVADELDRRFMVVPCKVLIEDAAGYNNPQAEDGIVYRVTLNFYDGRRLPGVDGVLSAVRLTNDPAVKVWAAARGSEHHGYIQGPSGRQVLKAWITPRLYTGPCQEGVQGSQKPPETPLPAGALPAPVNSFDPASPAQQPGEADMRLVRRLTHDTLELGTLNDCVPIFDCDGIDEVLIQIESKDAAWPSNGVVSVEVNLGGNVWYGVPGGAITFSANTLSNRISVRNVKQLRLRVTTAGSTAVYGRVIISGSSDL